VEGSEEGEGEAVVAVVPLEVHRAVPAAHVRQVARRVVPDPEALLHPVADPAVPHELASPADPLDRADHPPSPMVLVRVLVLAFWGVPALVGFVDPSSVDIVEGAVAMMGQLPVEMVPLTRWFLPW
jgi:hypothetical protein